MFIFPLLAVSAVLHGYASPAAPMHRALLIGVSEYTDKRADGSKAINDLTSYVDIKMLVEALKPWHFDEIKTLPDISEQHPQPSETSKAAIVKALTNFAAECRPGDTVYIHYSGHGVEVPDQPGHTIHPEDHLEHCICPSDTAFAKIDKPSENVKAGDIDPDSVILGSDLGKYLELFKGTNLVITFDCCHAGRNTRSLGVSRGIDNSKAVSRVVGTTRSITEDPPEENHFGNGNSIKMYASRATQKAWEAAHGGGRFTTALAHALQFDGSIGYRQLIDDINGYLHTISSGGEEQDAELEGQGTLQLFSENVAPRPRIFPIHYDGSNTILSAGFFQGITQNSVLAVWPKLGADTGPGTNAKPIGKLKVVNADPQQSYLAPFTSSAEDAAALKAVQSEFGGWGQLVMLGSGTFDVTTYARNLDTPADQAFWKALEDQVPLLVPVDEPKKADLVVEKASGSDVAASTEGTPAKAAYAVASASGDTVASVSTGNANPADALAPDVMRLAQWVGLKKFEDNPSSAMDVDVELDRVNVHFVNGFGKDVAAETPGAHAKFVSLPDNAKLSPGDEIHPGEYFAVKVRCLRSGNGKLPYISAVALQPNMTVVPQYPLKAVAGGTENQLKSSGDWYWLSSPYGFSKDPGSDLLLFTVSTDPKPHLPENPYGEGAGTEYFKVFATENPMDIQTLATPPSRGIRGRDIEEPQDPLARFIKRVSRGQQTRSITDTFSGNWCVKSTYYKIVDKASAGAK